MSRIDCNLYSSESCKKGEKEVFDSFTEIIVLACWGVYCQGGDYIYQKMKGGKMKGDPESVKRGQKNVFDAIRKYAKTNSVSDLFFAGDNIYQNAFPADEVGLDVGAYIDFHKDELGFQIDRQLESFEKCYADIPIKRTFVGFGNHDIETCEIFNKQLNFEGWGKLGTYYNVYYQDQKCNVIMIDTNLYEDDAKQCNGRDYEERDIILQTEFIVNQCKRSKERGDWVIVMGHIPYVANGHKEKRPIVHNVKLGTVFHRLRAEGCLPHLYICGDEHNQQFITSMGLPLAVIGSGGTELDPLFITNNDEFTTYYSNSNWGFLTLKIVGERLIVSFMSVAGKGDYEMKYRHVIPKRS
jgi:hypothetical protein